MAGTSRGIILLVLYLTDSFFHLRHPGQEKQIHIVILPHFPQRGNTKNAYGVKLKTIMLAVIIILTLFKCLNY